jgi:hypothetical protein
VEVTQEYIDMIVELAQEVELDDPIDWAEVNIGEDEAYRLMTLNLLEMCFDKYNDPGFKEMLLATVVKLVVENFTLNLRLREK